MIDSQCVAPADGGLHATHRARLARHQGIQPWHRTSRPRCLVHALPASTRIGNQSSRRIPRSRERIGALLSITDTERNSPTPSPSPAVPRRAGRDVGSCLPCARSSPEKDEGAGLARTFAGANARPEPLPESPPAVAGREPGRGVRGGNLGFPLRSTSSPTCPACRRRRRPCPSRAPRRRSPRW